MLWFKKIWGFRHYSFLTASSFSANILSEERWWTDNIFFTLSKDEKFIYAILTEEISDGKIKINGFLPFEDSEITHLGTNKKGNLEKLSETKFSINI